SPCSMADRIRVTSVMLGSLPRGERLVSPDGGRRLARCGPLDLRSEAEFASALRPDTPPSADAQGLLRPSRVQCCYTLSAAERLSPSARERLLTSPSDEWFGVAIDRGAQGHNAPSWYALCACS